jgi:hypothetical protein
MAMKSWMGVVLAMAAVLYSGCDKNEGSTGPITIIIAGATNFRAYSLDSSRVGLMWTASVDEARSELLNYRISVRDTSGNPLQQLTAVKGQTSAIVAGLTEGTIYVFVIRPNVTTGTAQNDSATVRWSPAKRFDFEGGTSSAPIQVFETADPNRPSGLDVYSSTVNGPVTRSLTSAPGNALIDFFVATLSSSQDLEIRSASLSSSIPQGRVTTFDQTFTSANSLNENGRTTPPDQTAYTSLVLTIPAGGVASGRIYWGKTQEGNVFRMLIVNNGGVLVSGPAGQRFLTFVISYQSRAGVPYARPGWIEKETITVSY